MQHLYNSRVQVLRQQLTRLPNGKISTGWSALEVENDFDMTERLRYLPCRIDVGFIRPGKDAAPALNAGRQPDRVAVVFFDSDVPIKAGDRIQTVDNEYGEQPVRGVFEFKVVPDEAVDFDSVHHKEAQAIETLQSESDWPTA